MTSIETIVRECMHEEGFASALRANRVDMEAFRRLIGAIEEFTVECGHSTRIEKLPIACLFELPWEIENCVEHYENQSTALGAEVSSMADRVRDAINELLWIGLEHYE